MPSWKTETGAYIPVEKMQDRHLANAYRYCSRKAEKYAAVANQLEKKNLEYTDEEYWTNSENFTLLAPELVKVEYYFIGWASTFSRELSRRGYHRIGDRFVKHSI